MKRLLLLAATLAAAGCASSGQVKALEQRVTLLETRLTEAEARAKREREEQAAKSAEEDKAIRRDVAMLGARSDAMTQRLQILEGRTEEVQTSAGKINVNATRMIQLEEEQLRLKDQNMQLDQRLAAMEKVLVGGGNTKPPFDDEAAYKEALAAHNAGDYAKAKEGFERLLRERPDSKLASNAVFWIGEGFYKQKAYADALGRYTNVVEKYPDSNKRCASLLKIGASLQEMGEKQKAKTFFTEVGKSCTDQPEVAQEAARRLKEK